MSQAEVLIRLKNRIIQEVYEVDEETSADNNLIPYLLDMYAYEDAYVEGILQDALRDAFLSTAIGDALYNNFGLTFGVPRAAGLTDSEYRSQLQGLVAAAVAGGTVAGIKGALEDMMGLDVEIVEGFRKATPIAFKFDVVVADLGVYADTPGGVTSAVLTALVRRLCPANSIPTVSEGSITLSIDYCASGTPAASYGQAVVSSDEFTEQFDDTFLNETYINIPVTTAYWDSAHGWFQLEAT